MQTYKTGPHMSKINYKSRHRWLCFVYFKHGNIFPSSAYLCKLSFFDSIDHAWTCLPIKSHSISPSWHTVKVRVQGSRVLCAHRCALFIRNPTFFSYCARMERSSTKVMDMDFLWFDSMKRSEEGTMKWQWGLHVALTGTAVVTITLKWQGLKTFQGHIHQNQEGSPELHVTSSCP